MTNIIVVFPKIEEAKSIKNVLVRSGFNVISACTTGAQAINATDGLKSGIIVCGYKFQDMLYKELKEYLTSDFDMLLVASQRYWEQCSNQNIMCLAMPLKVNDLVNTLSMMENDMSRRRKKKRLVPKQRSEEEQAVIDEAKEMLMSRNNMSEMEAHRYIQKCSMDSGNSLVETAQMVLSVYG